MLDPGQLPAQRPLVLLSESGAKRAAVEARLASMQTSGVLVTSVSGFARLILERALVPIPPDASLLLRRRLLAETLSSFPEDLGDLYRGAPRQVLGLLLPLVEEATLEEFHENSVRGSGVVAETAKARFSSLRRLALAYRARLEPRYSDQATLIGRAIPLRGEMHWNVGLLDTHVSRMFNHLLEGRNVISLPLKERRAMDCNRMSVYRPRDPSEEAELVAQVLLGATLDGWDQAVVVAHNSTAGPIAAVLESHGIPVSGEWARPLECTAGWRLVSAWMRILADRFGPGEAITAIRGLDSGAHARVAALVTRVSDGWICSTERLKALATDETQDLDRFLRSLPEKLGTRDAVTWIKRNVLSGLDKRFYASPGPAADSLRRAARCALDLLEELVEVNDVEHALEEALHGAPDLSVGGPGPGVHITTSVGDLGLNVRLLVATGFVAGRYPNSVAHRPIVGDPERKALGLPTSVEELRDRREDLLDLLDCCDGDIIFSAPHRWEGKWVEPSLFLDELVATSTPDWKVNRVVDLGAPEAKGPAAPETLRLAIRRVTGALNAPAPRAQDLAAARALAVDPASRDILAAPLRPSREFRLAGPVNLERVTLSPSTLADQMSCRFNFFAGGILELSDLPSIGRPEFSPLVQGAVVHKVMELLTPEVMAGTATTAKALKILERVLLEFYPWTGQPHLGLSVDSLRSSLKDFVPRYFDLLKAVGGTPLAAELPVRTERGDRPLLPLPSRVGIPKSIPVGGRIDQPILLPGNTSLVLDFKLGSVATQIPARAAQHLDTQAPLYAWYMDNDARYPRPVAALYLSVRKDEAVIRLAKSGSALVDMIQPVIDLITGPSLEGALPPIQNMVADLLGSFGGTDPVCDPVDPARWKTLKKAEADPCHYCTFPLLCRSRKE